MTFEKVGNTSSGINFSDARNHCQGFLARLLEKNIAAQTSVMIANQAMQYVQSNQEQMAREERTKEYNKGDVVRVVTQATTSLAKKGLI